MIVIKVGGGEGINYDYICEDIAELVKKNEKAIYLTSISTSLILLSGPLIPRRVFIAGLSRDA